MKKLVLLFAMVALTATASMAQFRAGFMLDYAIPAASGNGVDKVGISDATSGGFGGRLIARYAVTEQIDVGLEGGAYLFAGATENSAGLSAMTLAQVTGDYYFSTNKFAPYAGAGIGYSDYAAASLSVSDSDAGATALAATTFAFSPRVGFKYGSFNMDLSYNLMMGAATNDSGSVVVGEETVSVQDGLSVNNSHLKIGLGFIFGSRD